MYQYFLALLLINSYYQSLGNPVPPNLLISYSLTNLASQCENAFLSNTIKETIKDCIAPATPYLKKQIRCLIFYDINRQLCSAVGTAKIALNVDDYGRQIVEKQDINSVCTAAKDWVFTNLTEYVSYKNNTESLLKWPATCGEICGVEDIMNEANFFCKYYKWGIEMLKNQVSTTAVSVNNNEVDAPVIPEPDSNPKVDIAVPINNNQLKGNTKTQNVQIKQTQSSVPKTSAAKTEESGDITVAKPTDQVTSKQLVDDNDQANDKLSGIEAIQDHPIDVPDVEMQGQTNKTTVPNELKIPIESDPAVLPETGKDIPQNTDLKEVVLEKAEGKAPSDPDDYSDSEGNDGADDDGDDQGLDIKSGAETKQNSFIRTQLVPIHNGDLSQKEYYPNPMTDTFSDDGDHFFPFFLIAVILVVLLYVLYHNKSKVGKVFFGLILEGRQSSRRRNSRGHAYRRLDTLEQAMTANTAAPPSKIIY